MGRSEQAFDDWFRALLPDAVTVAQRILGSRHEAEDAAAESFARALVRWSRVKDLGHRDAWLLRTVTNVALDWYRKRRTMPIGDNPEADIADAAALRLALAAALERLPRRQRQVLVLRYLAEWPAERVAASLGVSANTVKKHTDRGMASLRDSVGSTRESFNAL